MKFHISYLTILLLFIIKPIKIFAQDQVDFNPRMMDDRYKKRVSTAIKLLKEIDTNIASKHWPSINPKKFYNNLLHNIEHPDKFNQGRKTNFCGFAAISHTLIRYQPDVYAKLIVELYNNGVTYFQGGKMNPSKRVKNAVGTLRFHGELDINHADQVWLLTLADCYKGYLNYLNLRYHYGDESIVWASVNYGKFNRILSQLGRYDVEAKGTDLIKPRIKNHFEYLSKRLKKGIVMVFLNAKALQPSSYKRHLIVTPTHFIQLYGLEKLDDGKIILRFWDYGEITEMICDESKLKETIYGVTLLTTKENQ